MAKEMDSLSMSLGVFEVLKESLRLPFRNRSLFLSIALFLIIPTYIFFLFKYLAIKPLIMDVVMRSYQIHTSGPQSPHFEKLEEGRKKDIGILVGEETLYVVLCSIVSLAATIATVYGSAMVYHGKNLTNKGLLVRIKRTWKQPVITWLVITLFRFGILVLIVSIMGFVVLIVKSSTSLVVVVVLTILLLRFYVYLAVGWEVGIVVSVLEDDSYGMGAIAKAEELIKGRKRQGYLIYVLFNLIGWLIVWVLNSAMQDIHRSHVSRLLIGLVMVFSSCLEHILIYIAFTVFYSDCRKSRQEEIELEGESGYSLVFTSPQVEAAVP